MRTGRGRSGRRGYTPAGGGTLQGYLGSLSPVVDRKASETARHFAAHTHCTSPALFVPRAPCSLDLQQNRPL
jgi:hypothetical protein